MELAFDLWPFAGFGSYRQIRRYVDDSVVLGFFPFGTSSRTIKI